jgi:hypothetical protein
MILKQHQTDGSSDGGLAKGKCIRTIVPRDFAFDRLSGEVIGQG